MLYPDGTKYEGNFLNLQVIVLADVFLDLTFQQNFKNTSKLPQLFTEKCVALSGLMPPFK